MFGSSGSPPKHNESPFTSTSPEKARDIAPVMIPNSNEGGGDKGSSTESPASPVARKSTDEASPNGEKRSRRSSGIRTMFSNARNSFSSSPTRPNDKTPQTPIQKLGRSDPALVVPQGALNNAAGESAPGPRSTFLVGVTEDKNKKCRRTMEDTHAYLYNFLSTPAPSISSDSASKGRSSLMESSPNSSGNSSQPIVETDNGYFAIFDGHAGTFAAEWCGKKLHILLEENIRKNPTKPIPELLDETFTSVDQQLEKLPLKNSGCTAITAVLRWEDRIPNSQSATGSTAFGTAMAQMVSNSSTDSSRSSPAVQSNSDAAGATEAKLREAASRQRVLYTANVGDARIVLCRNGKALRLSYDHKGSDENEGRRVANAGGLILNNRVNGVLAVTRALGDAYMKDLVTGHPYTTETVIQPDIDEFMILACDGLWDVCSDQEAVDLVRHTQDPQLASKHLVDHALARFSTDNLSCMIVRFNNRAVQDTLERRAEPIGVEGDPGSSVPGGIRETEAIVGAAKIRSKEMSAGEGVAGGHEEMIMEETGMEHGRDPGPQLDGGVLAKKRSKAMEGQQRASSEAAERR